MQEIIDLSGEIHLWKIVMSVSGVDAMLKKMDLSYTRPTYCLAKADPDKQEVFKKNSADND